jgi:hypothetical protein
MSWLRKYTSLSVQFFCRCIPIPYLMVGLIGFVLYVLFASPRRGVGVSDTIPTTPGTIGAGDLKSVIEAFMTPSSDDVDKGAAKGQKRKGGQQAYEMEARRYVETLFDGHKFPKTRPEWLINPATGRRMELDMYCEALDLALEYDGAQHEHFTPHWHRTYDVFEQQQTRDRLKDRICADKGVHLLRIPYNIPYDHLGAYIEGGLSFVPRLNALMRRNRHGGH